MKKVLFALCAATLILSCQKEVPNQQKTVAFSEDEVIETNPADSVVFYGWGNSEGVKTTPGGRYAPVFIDDFRVTDSTAFFFKKAVFKLRFSRGVHPTKARIYLDSYRHPLPLKSIMTGDSIVFENRNALQLIPTHINRYEHWMQMDIFSTGNKGDSMQATLAYVIVINKLAPVHYQIPQSQIKGLPEMGPAIHFVQ